MKTLAILIIVIGVISNLPCFGQQGKACPDFELQTLNGKVITSNELKGKIILLDFWDTHCGPCIKLMPHMEKLYSK